jgi:hypothetical protein
MATYTEFRIFHKSEESKKQYEAEIDETLKRLGFTSRAEWLRQMVRDAKDHVKRLDAQTAYINAELKGEGRK